MASDSVANKSPTLSTDELKFFESIPADKPTTASTEDELKFFGKSQLSPSAVPASNATKSGSSADLLVDFDGAKNNANAGAAAAAVAAAAAASSSADTNKNVSLLDDTPLDS